MMERVKMEESVLLFLERFMMSPKEEGSMDQKDHTVLLLDVMLQEPLLTSM